MSVAAGEHSCVPRSQGAQLIQQMGCRGCRVPCLHTTASASWPLPEAPRRRLMPTCTPGVRWRRGAALAHDSQAPAPVQPSCQAHCSACKTSQPQHQTCHCSYWGHGRAAMRQEAGGQQESPPPVTGPRLDRLTACKSEGELSPHRRTARVVAHSPVPAEMHPGGCGARRMPHTSGRRTAPRPQARLAVRRRVWHVFLRRPARLGAEQRHHALRHGTDFR